MSRPAVYRRISVPGRMRAGEGAEEVVVCKCPSREEFTLSWGLDIGPGGGESEGEQEPESDDESSGAGRPALGLGVPSTGMSTPSTPRASGTGTPTGRRKGFTVHFVDRPSPLEDDGIDALILKLLVSQDRYGVYSWLENVLEMPIDLVPAGTAPGKLSGGQRSARRTNLATSKTDARDGRQATDGTTLSLVDFTDRIERRQLNRSRMDSSLYCALRRTTEKCPPEFIDGREASWLRIGDRLVNGLSWMF